MTVPEVYDSVEPGKDYVLHIRVKNGPLTRALRMRGFHNVRSFVDASGVTAVYKYLSLQQRPILKNGNWSPSALKMAKFLRLPPDSLFPPQHLENILKRNSGELEISREEVALLLEHQESQDPQKELEQSQFYEFIHAAIDQRLTEREREVVNRRFGFEEHEHTLEQVADIFGVHRERIRQIEAKALRKLRYFLTRMHVDKYHDVPVRELKIDQPKRSHYKPITWDLEEPPPETEQEVEAEAIDRHRMANGWPRPRRGYCRQTGSLVFIWESDANQITEDQKQWLEQIGEFEGLIQFRIIPP